MKQMTSMQRKVVINLNSIIRILIHETFKDTQVVFDYYLTLAYCNYTEDILFVEQEPIDLEGQEGKLSVNCRFMSDLLNGVWEIVDIFHCDSNATLVAYKAVHIDDGEMKFIMTPSSFSFEGSFEII